MKRILSSDLVCKFKEHLIGEERSENTTQKYLRDIKFFMVYTGKTELTKETVIAYKKYLQENYKVRSVNSMLASINSLFAFLGWYELRVKALKVQQQVFCPEEKELSKAEYERLCNTAEKKHNERLNLILQTICGTGIRVSELQFITVEAVKRSEAVVSLKGKTRSVFIVKALKQKLLRYCAEHGIKNGMIFVTKSGKAISRTNIWREMKALCKEANVNPNKVFPHNLRHLFARTSWGTTQGPVYSNPTGNGRNVWSESYETARTTHYKYYHRYKNGHWSSDALNPAYERHSIDLTYALSKGYVGNNSSLQYYGTYVCPDCGAKGMWLPDGTYDSVEYGTRWYYQEPIYTYYYYRWSSYSDWSDTVCTASDTRQIKTRTVYRYKLIQQ